jgi:hypothetical protein
MTDLAPILVAGLFREINGHLLALLRSLALEDWHRPTGSSRRNVKDIASHLLDGSLRRLSLQRDGYVPPGPPHFASYRELADYLHRLNAEWTTATRRLSPRILIQWLEATGGELADLFERLDPFSKALRPVAWAGQNAAALRRPAFHLLAKVTAGEDGWAGTSANRLACTTGTGAAAGDHPPRLAASSG